MRQDRDICKTFISSVTPLIILSYDNLNYSVSYLQAWYFNCLYLLLILSFPPKTKSLVAQFLSTVFTLVLCLRLFKWAGSWGLSWCDQWNPALILPRYPGPWNFLSKLHRIFQNLTRFVLHLCLHGECIHIVPSTKKYPNLRSLLGSWT